HPRPLDRRLCRERNRIERFFGRIREAQRVGSRTGKTARNVLAAVQRAVSRYPLRALAKPLNGDAA
ncbi:MAG: hypothetical protein OXC91_02515, partial [Rhodobacteraceae bacterium]|nr:hypothetical protein [Paracoccaceae bacterium]